MSWQKKALASGFLFGAVGLYVIAVLALVARPIEIVGDMLFAPGRLLAAWFVGANGSNAEVLLLSLANGFIYALIFLFLAFVVRKFKGH